jgi:hypothetical protein
MSERSKQLAAMFNNSKERQGIQNELDLRNAKLLDESFLRMQAEINSHIERLCAELNQEPEIGDILRCDFSDKETKVTRTDTGNVLSAKFDPFRHSVGFVCPKPTNFKYSITVKKGVGDSWYYADGDDGSIGDKLGWLADKVLRALLGLNSSG